MTVAVVLGAVTLVSAWRLAGVLEERWDAVSTRPFTAAELRSVAGYDHIDAAQGIAWSIRPEGMVWQGAATKRRGCVLLSGVIQWADGSETWMPWGRSRNREAGSFITTPQTVDPGPLPAFLSTTHECQFARAVPSTLWRFDRLD